MLVKLQWSEGLLFFHRGYYLSSSHQKSSLLNTFMALLRRVRANGRIAPVVISNSSDLKSEIVGPVIKLFVELSRL